MNKYVIFENDGELDARSISTFGCSVKTTTNPIGFFGTGLKYAIAVLIRTGHGLSLQCGAIEYQPFSMTQNIRGKDFGFIYLNEQTAMGFTTELGKTWELWMAYRELYCNAKDETGCNIYLSDEFPAPTPGKTRVIVSGDTFVHVHKTREEFILEGEPSWVLAGIEVYSKPSRNFFYKGIRVMQFERAGLFTYNQTDHIDLTEDRTVKAQYEPAYNAAKAILTGGSKELLEKVLVAPSEYNECVFDFHWDGLKPGDDFFPTVERLQRDAVGKLNSSALRFWRKKCGKPINPRKIELTKMQQAMMERAIKFCEKGGFMIRDEYPIIVVESLGEETLGLADIVDKRILISERVLHQGTKQLVATLIEEYIHLKHGYKDLTRQLQTFLFDRIASLIEELAGEPI